MLRAVLAGACAAGCLAGLACTAVRGSRPIPEIYASELGRRLAQLEVGEPQEQARSRIGTSRVRVPGQHGESFDTPLRRLTLAAPDGRSVEIELYVVWAVRAEGCPGAHIALAPVVYLDGQVAAADWDYVEAHWRSWGGGLAALREARATFACHDTAASS